MSAPVATFCCPEFERQASSAQTPIGGGFLYPENPDKQFEHESDGTWSIYGCCGGECYVVFNMRYCHYCGARVAT